MTIDLGKIDVCDLFENAININNRRNLFSDLRYLFKQKIIEQLNSQGIETTDTKISSIANILGGKIYTYPPVEITSYYKTNIEYCAVYGFGTNSITGINWQNRPYYELPTLLTFKKIKNFSIGE